MQISLGSNKKYYPFGSVMPNRKNGSALGYRYGFGGQEKDDEISGNNNSYTAAFWEYDPRLGRRWNIDPVVKPWESSYATFSNNPIFYNDPDGLTANGGGGAPDPKHKKGNFRPGKGKFLSAIKGVFKGIKNTISRGIEKMANALKKEFGFDSKDNPIQLDEVEIVAEKGKMVNDATYVAPTYKGASRNENESNELLRFLRYLDWMVYDHAGGYTLTSNDPSYFKMNDGYKNQKNGEPDYYINIDALNLSPLKFKSAGFTKSWQGAKSIFDNLQTWDEFIFSTLNNTKSVGEEIKTWNKSSNNSSKLKNVDDKKVRDTIYKQIFTKDGGSYWTKTIRENGDSIDGYGYTNPPPTKSK